MFLFPLARTRTTRVPEFALSLDPGSDGGERSDVVFPTPDEVPYERDEEEECEYEGGVAERVGASEPMGKWDVRSPSASASASVTLILKLELTS